MVPKVPVKTSSFTYIEDQDTLFQLLSITGFDMKKIIVITAFKRPSSLEKLLISLCLNNLSGWAIIIRLEPSSETALCALIAKEILKDYDFDIHVNKIIEGVRMNTFNAVQSAFTQDAEVVLYLEEDLIVSPDTLDMCNWYYENHSDDILCLNLLARITGSSACFSSLDYPKELIKTKSFNSLGIALTKKQWEAFFKDSWLLRPKNHLTYRGQKTDGWDFSIYNSLLSNPNLYVLQPLLARANHVGGKGTYCTDEYQDKSFSYVEICQEKIKQYCIAKSDDLKGCDRAFFILMDEFNHCVLALSNTEKERKDNLRSTVLYNFKKRIKEGINELKHMEKNQLTILSIKEKRLYKWLKRSSGQKLVDD